MSLKNIIGIIDDVVQQAMQKDYEFFETHPDEIDYFRLMVRGETYGYFPPMTVVHVAIGDDCEWIREYFYPPRSLWRELENKYGKMNSDEIVASLETEYTDGLFQMPHPKKHNRTEVWEIVSPNSVEWETWHQMDNSCAPDGCVWRVVQPAT
jgi:hypothetical protein